jgi:hypothetical protein
LKKITEKLSSMHLTLWVLVFMIMWVGAGLYMAGSESFTKDFRLMNNMLVRDWLFSNKTGAVILKTWFVILCAAMTVIGINLIFCSWSKIFRIMKIKFGGNQLFMLIVHCIFGFVALGHLGGLMLGFEYNNIRLGEDEKHSIAEGYRIGIKKIHFVGNAGALNKGKRNITRNDLNYKESYAEVSLSKGDDMLKTQKVYLLKPLNYRDVHVTLSSFVASEDSNRGPGTDVPVLGMFTISCNPALKPFLTIYPVMIAGILIYLVMTWRKSQPAVINRE